VLKNFPSPDEVRAAVAAAGGAELDVCESRTTGMQPTSSDKMPNVDRRRCPDMGELVRSHVDYGAWATGRVLAACATLTSEELTRDLATSHGSVLGVLRHMYYAERVWLKRLRENAMPQLREVGDQRLFRDPAPEPDLDALRRVWPSVWDGLRAYCETTSEADLAGDLCGPDCAMARWQVLLHVVNHATLHRGQVIALLRQLGKAPPNADIFGFYLEGRAATG